MPKDVWALSNSALRSHSPLSLCFALIFSLSPRLACTPFSPSPRVLGGHMRCSDPTLILLPVPRYNLIFSAGEMEEWAKIAPQTNNSSLSDNGLMEISPLTRFPFDLILLKVRLCKYSISARCTCFPFVSATVRKKKPHRTAEADWICPSKGF